MRNEMALWLALGPAIAAILYGIWASRWILAQPAGNEKMQSIAAAVQEGAKAYMNRQYSTIGIVGVVLFVVVGFLLDWATAANSSSPALPRLRSTTRRVLLHSRP